MPVATASLRPPRAHGDAPSTPGPPEVLRLERLRARDEAAFTELSDQYATTMLRVARTYVPSQAVAEEVVQETWLGVLTGLERFEGRSSLRTWLFRILVNRARTRGERERRTVPFATLARPRAEGDEGTVDPERCLPARHGRWPQHWAAPPERWEESPERSLQSAETFRAVREAIQRLSPMQRLVITMRDLEGWDSEDVCDALDISQTNQRVLLHRARASVRGALETGGTSAPEARATDG